MGNRLYRSSRQKMVGGVCGGIAGYFDVDVTLIRLIAIMTLFMGGAGFFIYIAALFIIPSDSQERPISYGSQGDHVQDVVDEVMQNVKDTARDLGVDKNESKQGRTAGLILIVLGVAFLINQWLPLWDIVSKMWPLVLIIIGATLIWKRS